MPSDSRRQPARGARVRAERWWVWRWTALDVVAAALLTASSLAVVDPGGLPSAVGYLVVLAMAPPLAVRRRWPVPVFCLVLVAGAVAPAFGIFRDASLAIVLALYPILLASSTRVAAAATVAAVVTMVLGELAGLGFRFPESEWPIVGAMLATATTIAVAVAVRTHRSYVTGQRELAATRAVTRERLRIARELHDVIAHGLSLITIQAGVARFVVDDRPEEARRALESIERIGRSGLAELRQMLSTLRSEDADRDDGADGLLPTPGLSDLDALVSEANLAGVRVTIHEHGVRPPLPPGMELSVYRIIQEALTNVVRHAAPAQATLLLQYRPDSVVIELTDDGGGAGSRPPAGTGAVAGHGLLGMRERVAVYGGRLEAGPLPPPEVGFRVRASLPITAPAPVDDGAAARDDATGAARTVNRDGAAAGNGAA